MNISKDKHKSTIVNGENRVNESNENNNESSIILVS
jgi:hypothetical protein